MTMQQDFISQAEELADLEDEMEEEMEEAIKEAEKRSKPKTKKAKEKDSANLDKYPRILVSEEGIFKRVETDDFMAWAPDKEDPLPIVELEEDQTLPFIWKGAKISHKIWATILRFLYEINKAHSSEAMVTLYYHPQNKAWLVEAMPQEGVGMSIETIRNDDYDSIRAEIADYVEFGSVHSHCNAPAFQSGVDEDDEHDRDGIHITIGHLNQAVFDSHTRVVYRKGTFNFDFENLIEMDPEIEDLLKKVSRFIDAPIEAYEPLLLAKLVLDDTFIDKALLDKWIPRFKKKVYTHQRSGYWGYNTYYQQGQFGSAHSQKKEQTPTIGGTSSKTIITYGTTNPQMVPPAKLTAAERFINSHATKLHNVLCLQRENATDSCSGGSTIFQAIRRMKPYFDYLIKAAHKNKEALSLSRLGVLGKDHETITAGIYQTSGLILFPFMFSSLSLTSASQTKKFISDTGNQNRPDIAELFELAYYASGKQRKSIISSFFTSSQLQKIKTHEARILAAIMSATEKSYLAPALAVAGHLSLHTLFDAAAICIQNLSSTRMGDESVKDMNFGRLLRIASMDDSLHNVGALSPAKLKKQVGIWMDTFESHLSVTGLTPMQKIILVCFLSTRRTVLRNSVTPLQRKLFFNPHIPAHSSEPQRHLLFDLSPLRS